MKYFKKHICFYFQVHQPLRLAQYSYFDINSNKEYFSLNNADLIHKIAKKCYMPANRLLSDLLSRFNNFKCAFSITGITLEQFKTYQPELIESFQKLIKTDRVEVLSETYYHSLASVYSLEEFVAQIILHRKIIWDLFKKKPKIFRNTELIYNNQIGEILRNMGFKGVLAEGWDTVLEYRSPNYLYIGKQRELSKDKLKLIYNARFTDIIPKHLHLLLKNYRLSDDIAFRFSDRTWSGFPLTSEKFAEWVSEAPGDIINIFMDYETFGEHQWKETGIFDFLQRLPYELSKRDISFITPSEILIKHKAVDCLDYPKYISWADVERDLSAWTENRMQKESIKKAYELQTIFNKLSKKINNSKIIGKYLDIWRKLQTSDHFYYMSTKYWADGNVHAYFSHYDSPYDAYINYMNVLNDFRQKLLAL